MTVYEQNPLERLALQPGDVEEEFDLGSLGAEAALHRLDAFLEQAAHAEARRYAIRFAPARGDGRQTLFQPIGRHLLQARKQGHIARCLPLSDGSGYYVELPPHNSSSGSGAD